MFNQMFKCETPYYLGTKCSIKYNVYAFQWIQFSVTLQFYSDVHHNKVCWDHFEVK